MAIKVLLSDELLPSSKLAGEYCVTKTTLLKDIEVLEETLRKYDLSLHYDPKNGYAINGHRSHRRFLTCLTLCEEHFINKIPLNNMEIIFPTKLPFKYLWDQQKSPADFEFIKRTIDMAEDLLQDNFSQAGYSFLFYYLLVLLIDIRSDKQINDKEVEAIGELKESLLENPLRTSIETYTRKNLADSEIQLLILHCHCLPRLMRFNKIEELSEDQPPPSRFSAQLNTINRKLVREISLNMNPYLYIDEIFQNELNHFLEVSTQYKKYGFTLLFPFEKEIQRMEIDTFNLIKRIVLKNSRSIKLDDHEICALTSLVISNLNRINRNLQKDLKVLLVNNGNASIASIMKDRIKDNFPWFNIIDLIRPADIRPELLKKVNLVISTDGIPFEKSPPTVLVTPIISESDIREIQNWFAEYTRQLSRTNAESEVLGISELLEKGAIGFVNHVETWQEAVHLAGKPLVNKGSIDNGYLEAIIKTNVAHGPYSVVAPHIALLHAMPTTGVSELCVGLLIIKQGIKFGADKLDPVHILFIIGIPRVLSHFNLLNDLLKLIRKKGFFQRLLQCNLEKEVQSIIQNELIA